MNLDRESVLANSAAYHATRDELADAVLSGRVGLDLHQLADEAMSRFNLTHQHAHELADQFLLDLRTDRRVHDRSDSNKG
ncbi:MULTISPECIES: hypothetical protein [Burkholderia cepacia complex]|uniref:hypothetical protein n=1 Tax=Burkholderia cepacia complex TaxID=87882 RepID=UPI0007529BA8|nr:MULTISPECIES: hypothetical protein [Burkholderia cepacia complex]KVX59329.1 hypothetical protein WL06_05865 [Burkholderia cepacia]KWD63387.1 hypothetical protein WL68_00470 [Burkholderia cepacia]KWD84419.1 hypothetical protein WL69_12745 [Burkholderia cepacia]MBR8188792.1 hypothetical protein [Burkholderia vietnamiensis]